jgi:hypothetical protein
VISLKPVMSWCGPCLVLRVLVSVVIVNVVLLISLVVAVVRLAVELVIVVVLVCFC